ncbi:hypothetical protein HS088_TW22G00960 [Tripterygium wilfordii]|uniref:Sialate O-acetylesterase domain-containing protein n=1 Tax=Tripterygium wilfordii TaxID=458696 RepID=A0A7J7BZD2_TRIWF|nr:hypothetical protein HS088_TW22G00960 [Tripterygium wilfordii]
MVTATKHIFILSGQSNMAGRGGVIRANDHHHQQHWDGIVPPECQPHPKTHRLGVTLHWEQARVPLHADIDTQKIYGLGPGMSVSNAIKDHYEEEVVVGLVHTQ